MSWADWNLLWFVVPAVGLAVCAQVLIQWACAHADRFPARMSGFAAARHMLDGAGLYDVSVQQVPGPLSDHYDPREPAVRLSREVYHGRSLTAVGLAAHEAGHALQHARGYRLFPLRQLAVPAATFGSGAGIMLAAVGLLLRIPPFLLFGVALFCGVVVLQLLNLPVELNAGRRAFHELCQLNIVETDDARPVRRVLTAAATIQLAATLQSVFTLMTYVGGIFRARPSD